MKYLIFDNIFVVVILARHFWWNFHCSILLTVFSFAHTEGVRPSLSESWQIICNTTAIFGVVICILLDWIWNKKWKVRFCGLFFKHFVMVILTRHFILGSHCSIAQTEGAGPQEEGQFPEIGGNPGVFFCYRIKAVKTRKKPVSLSPE